MPGLTDGPRKVAKRQHCEDEISSDAQPVKPSKLPKSVGDNNNQICITWLEQRILESRRHYNHVVTLIHYAQKHDPRYHTDHAAVVALCRVFCRLMIRGNLAKSRETAENEVVIIQWLKARYLEYVDVLILRLINKAADDQSIILSLLLRLVKMEVTYLSVDEEATWRSGTFAKLLRTLITSEADESTRKQYIQDFVEKYADIRYFTFVILASVLSEEGGSTSLDGILSMLSTVKDIPKTQGDIRNFYIEYSPKKKKKLTSLAEHKKQAQETWMTVLRSDLSKAQRKTALGLMSHQITPWFLKAELLMDFLTDSFNVGGSTSLTALSGLFSLIQERNLDYPQFYSKLYSLLDRYTLHSKHRSQFFRLLETFLASTHLPAALVASFTKRLARLCLYSPPSGIVFVVPWIYNLLKTHPTCTFMIHREVQGEANKKSLANQGMGDPFKVEESDPMLTSAIESSLWEIRTLQSHYQPNTATIAKIISERFTKQYYSLEDFLDHSYGNMLEAELAKDIKKPPAVEYSIPKGIAAKDDGESPQQDSLLGKLWKFDA